MCFAALNEANAAARVGTRGTASVASARKSIAAVATKTETPKVETVIEEEPEEKPVVTEPEPESKPIIVNKSSDFDRKLSSVIESASDDNSFAEQIRRQKAALAASEAATITASAQRAAFASNSNSCDRDLRKCMMEKCGDDFTKCALDGDTAFGDKLNSCRRNTTCSGEEFTAFVPEIKADRDMNVRLASYENVINCGNGYNACIMEECGTTYNKCLGKSAADSAIQKCSLIAKECTESDSGLAARFGTVIGKLRETAEKDVQTDEKRMYALRDLMSKACTTMGAMFDERTFDCVYTVNFFAGSDQSVPMASRKRYAGDTFVCMQEWFGVNTTTFKENAYRETRAQTAASSAMLGSGVGTAVGLLTSGAIGRALDTQKAKKALDKECGGKANKDGECISEDGTLSTGTGEVGSGETEATEAAEATSSGSNSAAASSNNGLSSGSPGGESGS